MLNKKFKICNKVEFKRVKLKSNLSTKCDVCWWDAFCPNKIKRYCIKSNRESTKIIKYVIQKI